MSTFQFRPAKREGVHLLLGMIGGTGSGKTYSAMRLATGLAGGARFAVIDTEAGRASHYADEFQFDAGELKPPFRPDAYLEAILAAEKAGYPVIVVDSMSHEHNGVGGVMDWAEEEWEKMGRRESCQMTRWIAPKMAHKRMIAQLLQLRAHLILCCRAEQKVRMETDPKTNKIVVVDAGWQPTVEKDVPFEMTASFLLSHERPGLPDHPLKLPAKLRPAFPAGKPIDEECGRAVLAWAAGSKSGPSAAPVDGPIADSTEALLLTVREAGREELVALFARNGMPHGMLPPAWAALRPADKAALEKELRARCQALEIDGMKELKKLADAAT